MAYTAFWTKAPLGGIKIFQKEQPVMVKKPCLNILNFTLYILSQTTNTEELFFLSFISEKLSSLILFSLDSNEKDLDLKKEKFFGPREKKAAHTPMIIVSPLAQGLLKSKE